MQSFTVSSFLSKLQSENVRVVIFDFDQTIVQQNSQGFIHRSRLDDFTASVSPDFVTLVPLLLQNRMEVGIATYTDRAYYQMGSKESYIAGEDLVMHVLSAHLEANQVDRIFMVCFNPQLHEGDNPGKIMHVKSISAHFKRPLQSCILFDDRYDNIKPSMTPGFHGFYVDQDMGFRYENYREAAQ